MLKLPAFVGVERLNTGEFSWERTDSSSGGGAVTEVLDLGAKLC